MDPFFTIWLLLIGIIIGVLIGVGLSFRHAVTPLHQKIGKLTNEPERNQDLMKYYPYNLQRFRYLGDPIDGIQFEENKILFIQFNAKRSPEQEYIKMLVDKGKVEWFEFVMP
jgi:hypothetical protein